MSSSGRTRGETEPKIPSPRLPSPISARTRAPPHPTPILCCVCVSTTTHTQRKRESRGRRSATCRKAVSIVGIFRVLCQDTWHRVDLGSLPRLWPAFLRVTTRCRAFCPAFPLG